MTTAALWGSFAGFLLLAMGCALVGLLHPWLVDPSDVLLDDREPSDSDRSFE